MEVEISRKSLDWSRYWPVALVADNSHVVHLLLGRTRPKFGRVSIVITSHATTDRACGNAKMRDNPNEM